MRLSRPVTGLLLCLFLLSVGCRRNEETFRPLPTSPTAVLTCWHDYLYLIEVEQHATAVRWSKRNYARLRYDFIRKRKWCEALDFVLPIA